MNFPDWQGKAIVSRPETREAQRNGVQKPVLRNTFKTNLVTEVVHVLDSSYLLHCPPK